MSNGQQGSDDGILKAPLVIEYPFKRTTGPVIGAFLTGLREQILVGSRLEGGYIVIRCPMCKAEQRIALAELVLHHADEAREMERVVNGEKGRLMW